MTPHLHLQNLVWLPHKPDANFGIQQLNLEEPLGMGSATGYIHDTSEHSTHRIVFTDRLHRNLQHVETPHWSGLLRTTCDSRLICCHQTNQSSHLPCLHTVFAPIQRKSAHGVTTSSLAKTAPSSVEVVNGINEVTSLGLPFNIPQQASHVKILAFSLISRSIRQTSIPSGSGSGVEPAT